MRARIDASNLEDAVASLERFGKGVANRVLADALNHTANQARQALRGEMPSVFDRPTPFTLNAIRILNAKPNRLEAAVWVKDEKDGASAGQAPEQWVAPQVFGGERPLKRSEVLLRARGILPAGRFIVPARDAPLDRYGNISRGLMGQILSGLGSFKTSGYSMNASRSRRSRKKGHAEAFEVVYRGKSAIGITERRGNQVRMVLAFVRQPQYRQRLPFHDIVRRIAENDEQLETNIDKAAAEALAGRTPTSFRRRTR